MGGGINENLRKLRSESDRDVTGWITISNSVCLAKQNTITTFGWKNTLATYDETMKHPLNLALAQ